MNDNVYKSDICDRACDHKHRTAKAAEKCAAKRIKHGELQRLMGPHAVKHELDFYVREHHSNGMRVGG